MLERLRITLVKTYIGALALGSLLAQTVTHFINIFVMPIAGWVSRRQYRGFTDHPMAVPGFTLEEAIPELLRFICYLLIWFGLVRWLYFTRNEGAPKNN